MSTEREHLQEGLDNALEIIKPEPDSHYLLRPCRDCRGEAVYARYNPGMWRVVCTACGAATDLQSNVRHDVQVEWNRRYNRG